MNSMPKPEAVEPNNGFITRADEQLARAYRQITSADEQLAHVTEQLSKLERDDARHPPAARGRGRSRGGPALRGLTGLLLAACIFAAAFVLQSSYGDAAWLTIARWAPQLSSPPLMEKPGSDAQTIPSAVQLAQAESQVLPPTATTRPQGRTLPRYLLIWRTCSRQWPAISRPSNKESSSSRRARTRWPPTTPKLLNSSRRTRNKWRVSSQELPSRTCAPGHRRLRHGPTRPQRASRCQRRKREREPRRSCSPKDS